MIVVQNYDYQAEPVGTPHHMDRPLQECVDAFVNVMGANVDHVVMDSDGEGAEVYLRSGHVRFEVKS